MRLNVLLEKRAENVEDSLRLKYISQSKLSSAKRLADQVNVDLADHLDFFYSMLSAQLSADDLQRLMFWWRVNNEKGDLRSSEFWINEYGGVYKLSDLGLTDLREINFDAADAALTVESNELTSLEGAPSEVGGDFSCSDNKLTSLEGAPSKVSGHFGCSSNQLASLEGAPREVGGNFHCAGNRLASLEGVHKHLKKMDGTFWARGNPIKSHVLGLFLVDGCREVSLDDKQVTKILNKHLPEGRAGLTKAQNELIEAGLEEYAQV